MTEAEHICWGGGKPHTSSHILKVEGLSIRYGETLALDKARFHAHCGQTLALIGPNGAGKSSLLNCLAGLIRPASGSMSWNGKPLHRQRGEIAYMPQRSEVDWKFPISVRQLVEMGRYPILGPWRKAGEHDRKIVDKALDIMQLHNLQERQISELSGGQQQRAFLARAVAQEAHILLLDEPFNGLDLPGITTLAELLRKLAAEGRLVIASHHNLANAADIFDKSLLLKQRLIAEGPTAEILCPEKLQAAFGRRQSQASEATSHE